MAATAQGKARIPGYTYGTDQVAKSPIDLDEWESLKKSALFSEEDVIYLRLSRDVLKDPVEDLLGVWAYGVVSFSIIPTCGPTTKTLERERSIPSMPAPSQKRFGQWVLDTAKGEI